MIKEAVANRINWLTAIALFTTTVIVTPKNTLDPINVPKLWVLAILSFAVIAMIFPSAKKFLKGRNLLITLSALALPLSMTLSLALNDSPKTQQLFGTYGRNTGLLYYFGLTVLFLGVAIASNRLFRKPFVYSVIGALFINCTYGFIQAIGKDWVKWASSYSPVFGTLGNPDFISAFLGFGTAFAFSYLLAKDSSSKTRIATLIYIPIALFVIYKSKAQQGFIVLVIVLMIVIYFEMQNYLKAKFIQMVYLIVTAFLSLLAIFGSLQKGPLSDLLYRSSVTQRGDYWHAGIKMFWANPFTGVGLDSYGDWYRYFRSAAAADRFNGSVVANSAHNVFIDIASTSGIFAILSYLLMILLALRSSWNIYIANKKLDPFFIGVFSAWMGYLAQSIISINNIGLGIWGWVLPGLLIAIDRWQSEEKPEFTSKVLKKKEIDFSGMLMSIGLAVGFVIGFLPFNTDANFRHALESGNAEKIYKSAAKWPTDSARTLYAAKIFQSNNLNVKATALIRESLKLNPRSFESWRFLYESSSTSANEKAEILLKLKELDPNNRNIK